MGVIMANGLEFVMKMKKFLEDKFKAPKQEISDELIEEFQDILLEALGYVQQFELFVSLHIPRMEDGNNFGVNVQETVSKFLKETRKELLKHLKKIPEFYSSKADAHEKSLTEKTTTEKIEKKEETQSVPGGGGEGDGKKTGSVTVTEEKKKSISDDVGKSTREAHLKAINVQFYISVRAGLIDCITSYLSILDNLEKNLQKLTNPKGAGATMGMY